MPDMAEGKIFMKNLSGIVWGIVLVAVGIVIALNALGVADVELFFDGWWTLIIIIPCFVGLFTEKEKTGNAIGLLVGVILLLACRDIIGFEAVWKLILPIILIAIGVSMVFKNIFGRKISDEIKRLNEKKPEGKGYYAVFSGQNINFDGEVFLGADVEAIFGGIKLDLTRAQITSDVVVNATAVFGGIDILVPVGVNVKIRSSSLFGGVSDKTARPYSENALTVYVNASCMFGGVDVK